MEQEITKPGDKCKVFLNKEDVTHSKDLKPSNEKSLREALIDKGLLTEEDFTNS